MTPRLHLLRSLRRELAKVRARWQALDDASKPGHGAGSLRALSVLGEVDRAVDRAARRTRP